MTARRRLSTRNDAATLVVFLPAVAAMEASGETVVKGWNQRARHRWRSVLQTLTVLATVAKKKKKMMMGVWTKTSALTMVKTLLLLLLQVMSMSMAHTHPQQL